MGWFSRKRDPQDANEMLRQYNEAEAARLSAMTAGSAAVAEGAPIPSSAGAASEFTVEDVFTITGRGQVVTGKATSGVLRVGDAVAIHRGGAPIARTRINGIEMFRKKADEVAAGTMAGLLLTGKNDVARGDVIRTVLAP